MWWIWTYSQLLLCKLMDTIHHGVSEPNRITDGRLAETGAIVPASSQKSATAEMLWQMEKSSWLQQIFRNSYILSCVPATPITDNLWLGSGTNAGDWEFIQRQCISSVVNLTAEVPNFFSNDGVEYLHITNVRDPSDAQLIHTYEVISQYIEQCMQKNLNVLVHCFMGRSRSFAAVVHYLMTRKGYGLDRAILEVKCKRGFVGMNQTFYQELRTLDGGRSPALLLGSEMELD